MAIIFLTKNISCGNKDNDSANCSNTIKMKLETAYPNLKEHENYHLSILHEKNNHLIFFCVYEKDGFSVCCHSNSEIVKPNENYIATFNIIHNKKSIKKGISFIAEDSVKNPEAKKYTDKMPTESEIKKLI
jgi:hypothetical protein